jgi:hypothetical protein
VSASGVNTAAKAHLGLLTQGDLLSHCSMIGLLRSQFAEVGFDDSLKEFLRSVDASQMDLNDSPVVQTTFEALSKADSTFTLADVKAIFARCAQPERSQERIELLRTNGLTPSLAGLEQALSRKAASLPVAYDGAVGRAAGVRPEFVESGPPDGGGGTNQLCLEITYYSNALSTAAAVLALGCLPVEPFFVIICPAVVVLGILAALVATIVWIAC